jgi:putative DNA primase/helicase
VYDNRRGRGDYFCRQCGAGDGFSLLMRLNGWNFTKTCTEIAQAAGITSDRGRVSVATPRTAAACTPAGPTARVREILRSVCEPADLADAREYLGSRGLWPLPEQCGLRAHSSLDYWEGPRTRAGRYAALIAPVCDVAGELVTVHVTYLIFGRKLSTHEPRKILSPLAGREGCAVRLVPVTGDALGIAEGIESALSAHRMHDVPAWAALNAALLAKFEPPPGVRRLVVYADRDVAGLEAAGRLLERLQGRIAVELRTAPSPHNDWNDVLQSQGSNE